jgi:F0F1-type ATP synthase assembly protein I
VALAGAGAMKKQPGRDSGSALRAAGLLMFIPTLLVVAPLVGFFLGRLAERWLRIAPPWGTFVGLVLGFFAAGREIWAIIRRVQAEEEEGHR